MINTKKPLLNNNSLVGKYTPFLLLTCLLIILCLYRQLPTAADKEALDLLKGNAPNVETHPHTFAWFVLANKFHDSVKASWAAGAPAKGAEKKAAAPKKEEKKEEKVAAADDDELDLFGDGPSEVRLSFAFRLFSGCFHYLFYLYLIGEPY